jgi:hypothetical protein
MGKLKMGITKLALATGLLGGGLVLGSLVTYNGGAIVDKATTKITQQAEELGIYKSQQTRMVEKIQTLKAQVAELELNGNDKDQITIDALNAEIATIEANVDAGSEDVANRINALEAEVTKANDDAAELNVALTEAGETPQALSTYEFDNLMDEAVEGSVLLKMVFDTPQIVPNTNNMLKIDKTTTDIATAELKLINLDSLNYYYSIDGGEQQVISNQEVILGKVTDLDGSIMTITKVGSTVTWTYYLSAE